MLSPGALCGTWTERFTERYTQTVAQLGSPSATVRLGGIDVLVRIADDSPRFRPTCLKALCTYLRTPYDPDSDTADNEEHEVRTTAQTALGERLQERLPEVLEGCPG